MATPVTLLSTPAVKNASQGRTISQFYVDQMFNLGGAAVTTLTQMNATTTSAAGTYACKADGYLEKIFISITPQAASSLAQNGYCTFTTTAWKPVNTLTCPFNGFGLATAPQAIGGNVLVTSYPTVGDGLLHLPVSTALAITGSIIYFFSPVTPNAVISGLFSAF